MYLCGCLRSSSVLLVLGLSPGAGGVVPNGRLKPEETVTCHLASTGSAQPRAAVRTGRVDGTAVLNFRVGDHGHLRGSFR